MDLSQAAEAAKLVAVNLIATMKGEALYRRLVRCHWVNARMYVPCVFPDMSASVNQRGMSFRSYAVPRDGEGK